MKPAVIMSKNVSCSLKVNCDEIDDPHEKADVAGVVENNAVNYTGGCKDRRVKKKVSCANCL